MDITQVYGQTKNLRVLYVEDDKEVATQTIEIFEDLFSEVVYAKDGLDGLKKYAELLEKDGAYYDIVISDIKMPHMDGIEMALQILELNNNQQVLIISAYDDSDKLKKLLDLGVSSFMLKPIKNKILLNKLYKISKTVLDEKAKENHINSVEQLNNELDALIESFDTYVIASRTDLKGIITYSSKAYERISGYTKQELLGKPHNIVRHPDMPSSAFKDLWDTIQAGKLWVGEVKNLKKDGGFYWVNAYIAPYYDKNKKHVGYSAIRINITSQKKVEELNNKINSLLNNADEGFLSFDKNLKCDSSFSKECLKIFELEDITGCDISELLFVQDKQNKELFCDGIRRVLQSDDEDTKELFLSLLPKEQKICGKIVKIKYKLLEANNFMLVLDDITATKALEENLQKQEQIQKMLLSVAINQNEFLDLKLDFENFIKNTPKQEKTLQRELHTFKGIFAQKEMVYIVKGIHDSETRIREKDKDFDIVFEQHNLEKIFQKDLDIISKHLGEDFLNAKKSLKIEKQAIKNLEKKIALIDSPLAKEILADMERLRYQSFASMLNLYILHVKRSAEKFEKYVYPMEIKGDENILVSPKIKPFINSLVHLFNNCIDHGIEYPDARVDSGKDAMGTISCEFQKINSILRFEISDDGSGIDIKKLTKSAINKGIKSQEECDAMSEDEKLYLMFEDELSTKDKTTMTSGRGEGMSALKEELDKIGGTLKIKNSRGKGVKFAFTLPLGDD